MTKEEQIRKAAEYRRRGYNTEQSVRRLQKRGLSPEDALLVARAGRILARPWSPRVRWV